MWSGRNYLTTVIFLAFAFNFSNFQRSVRCFTETPFGCSAHSLFRKKSFVRLNVGGESLKRHRKLRSVLAEGSPETRNQ